MLLQEETIFLWKFTEIIFLTVLLDTKTAFDEEDKFESVAGFTFQNKRIIQQKKSNKIKK